ncbi:MAG: hypothetical protein MJ118_00485 [Clostridia bacterium]|nr:hypothetical protein [Clostridia bacterium]
MSTNSIIYLDAYRTMPTVLDYKESKCRNDIYAALRKLRKIRKLTALLELAVTFLIGLGFVFCIGLVITML